MRGAGSQKFLFIFVITRSIEHAVANSDVFVKGYRIYRDWISGTTELIIRQGSTSNQPSVEILRHPNAHYGSSKPIEHVVPVSHGFYISLRGIFTPESRLAIVYAAFNYKDCFGSPDFLCNNFRCIPLLLNCDGFDHCGDDSDELNCSQDPKDHREVSKIPNFLFPKADPYYDVTTATFVFLTCSFGLIGIILAMALLLYRVNVRAHHQRRFRDHIETIHAILDEGIRNIEEEIITPDEPPDYEHPPDYSEVLKLNELKDMEELNYRRCSELNSFNSDDLSERSSPLLPELISDNRPDESIRSISCNSRCFPTIPSRIPDTPPPAYENLKMSSLEQKNISDSANSASFDETENSRPGVSSIPNGNSFILSQTSLKNSVGRGSRRFGSFPICSSQILDEIRNSFRSCESVTLSRNSRHTKSCYGKNLVRYFSDSELISNNIVSIGNCTATDRSKLKNSFSTDDLSSF